MLFVLFELSLLLLLNEETTDFIVLLVWPDVTPGHILHINFLGKDGRASLWLLDSKERRLCIF